MTLDLIKSPWMDDLQSLVKSAVPTLSNASFVSLRYAHPLVAPQLTHL